MNGCQVRDSPGSGASVTQAALYRFHLLDAIQYLSSIHMMFEAYDPQDFSSVTFFYDFTPEPWTPDVLVDESFDTESAGWSYLAFDAWGLSAAIGEGEAQVQEVGVDPGVLAIGGGDDAVDGRGDIQALVADRVGGAGEGRGAGTGGVLVGGGQVGDAVTALPTGVVDLDRDKLAGAKLVALDHDPGAADRGRDTGDRGEGVNGGGDSG